MQDYIIIGVLAAIGVLALLRAKKHFSGGGCCGSGSHTIRDKKALTAPKIGEKTLTIEGMHCENCEIRVENALNRLEHVACKVSWKKKTAIVSYSSEISEALLRDTVEAMGYQVTAIR